MFDNITPIAVPAPFLSAGGDPSNSRTYDTEDGPIAYEDPSHGHFYQKWRAWIQNGNRVIIEADNLAPQVLGETVGKTLTDISICFNQNAVLHYAWVDNGVAKFRWFNSLIEGMDTLTLPAGARHPKCTLDDKRKDFTLTSDIVLSYLKRDNRLYYRLQSDRFDIEYQAGSGTYSTLEKCYMSTGNRLQWLLTKTG